MLILPEQEESRQQQEQYSKEEAQQQQQQLPEQAQEQEQQQQQEPASRQDRIGFIGAGQVCSRSCGSCGCIWAVLQCSLCLSSIDHMQQKVQHCDASGNP